MSCCTPEENSCMFIFLNTRANYRDCEENEASPRLFHPGQDAAAALIIAASQGLEIRGKRWQEKDDSDTLTRTIRVNSLSKIQILFSNFYAFAPCSAVKSKSENHYRDYFLFKKRAEFLILILTSSASALPSNSCSRLTFARLRLPSSSAAAAPAPAPSQTTAVPSINANRPTADLARTVCQVVRREAG